VRYTKRFAVEVGLIVKAEDFIFKCKQHLFEARIVKKINA